MNAIATIRKVIDSGILESALVSIPSRGATEQEIADEQRLLRLDLCPDHLQILRQWNGVDLEVIRLFGCGEDASPPGRLSENQTPMAVEGVTAIIVGSDPAGFFYSQLADGRIVSIDTDGGENRFVAYGFDDFISRLVFGREADRFAGDEWLVELRRAGIVS